MRKEVPVEADLKGSAAKVLLHLLRRRGETLSNIEIMRGSGVHDRNTFFAAKKQLQEFGLWEHPDGFFQTVGVIPQTVGGNTQTVGVIPPTVGGSIPTLRALPLAAEVVPLSISPSSPSAAGQSAAASVNWEEPTNHRVACMEADLLDDGGDEKRPTSPFQHRRTAQITALQAAWAALFRDKGTASAVSQGSVKELLTLAQNSAEAIFDVLESAAALGERVTYPLGYVKKVLQSKQDEAQRPSVKPAAIGKPAVGDEGVGRDDYYRDPPPDVKAKAERLRRVAPHLFGPDKDDWGDEEDDGTY